jgi:hypothetical protein
LQWIEDHGDLLEKLNGMGRMMNPVTAVQDIWNAPSNPFTRANGGWLDTAANGGMRRRMTWVGEHGPELIDGRGFVMKHSQSMGAGGGNTYITVQGAVDPVNTARQIERILAKGRRVTGAGGLATA